MGRVLVIDDEYAERQPALESELSGHDLFFARSGQDGIALLERGPETACVLLDICMPAHFGRVDRTEGLAVLRELRKRRPDLPVICLTRLKESESAARAMELGAFHYLTWPPDADKLVRMVDAAVENHALRMRVLGPAGTPSRPPPASRCYGDRFGCIVGASPPMQELYAQIERYAPKDLPVMILGDTGTGKELVAREIHDRSGRRGHRYEPANSATLDGDLAGSLLFGHKKGAFTGATADREGLFSLANGGTLFFDEIGELPLAIQAKLLRALSERTIRPLGGVEDEHVDVRVLCATLRDIPAMVHEATFREDLFYRLSVVTLRVPALRERKEDIPLLAEHFLAMFGRHHRKRADAIAMSSGAIELLMELPWSGNVRQLEHVLEKSVIHCDGDAILPEHVSAALKSTPALAGPPAATRSLWDAVLAGETPRTPTEFARQHGRRALREIVARALNENDDIRAAGMLLGFVQNREDKRGYDNLRKWLSRLGLSRRELGRREEC